jgi:hypothetical protein
MCIRDRKYYYAENVDWDGNYYNPNTKKWEKAGEADIKDRFNSFDIMARLDFGVEVKLLPNLILNAGLTTAYGLTDINADDYQIDDHTGEYTPSHNFYGGITAGISYAFGK